jgi:hypothetical protein
MAANSRGYTYNTRPNAEYQRFKEEYFSGQDVRIYLGDVWVDEIVDLRFQLMENTAPIFGYASYTYDAVAHGNRQIQGTFRINFKESYYLHSIINQLDYEMSATKEGPIANTKVPVKGISVDHLKSTIESIYSQKDFDALASQFEQSLWGAAGIGLPSSASSALTQQSTALQNKANTRGQQSFFTPENSRKNVHRNGFSIMLLYGPYVQGTKSKVNESLATTAKTITGVHITGVSQIIDGTGQPVYEEYSFIARDLDANVNIMDSRPQYAFGNVVDK